ncbi:MAG: RNase P subunit p30 family protein [archaeon]
MIIINESTFEKARALIKKAKKPIIFTSEDDDLNRKVLEKEEIDLLLINLKERKDFQKQRNSGFNQVLAKIAKSQGVAIGINLDEIIEAKEKAKAEILSRVRQNIRLCNKNKLKMKFIGQKYSRDKYDLRALGLVLGMPTWMAKEL